MPGTTPLTTPNDISIASGTFAQLRHKVPIDYNGTPHILPQNCPFPWAIPISVYLPHPWTQLTYHPKRCLDPISRFATILWNSPLDWRTYRPMVQATKPVPTTNTRLRSVNCIVTQLIMTIFIRFYTDWSFAFHTLSGVLLHFQSRATTLQTMQNSMTFHGTTTHAAFIRPQSQTVFWLTLL